MRFGIPLPHRVYELLRFRLGLEAASPKHPVGRVERHLGLHVLVVGPEPLLQLQQLSFSVGPMGNVATKATIYMARDTDGGKTTGATAA